MCLNCFDHAESLVEHSVSIGLLLDIHLPSVDFDLL